MVYLVIYNLIVSYQLILMILFIYQIDQLENKYWQYGTKCSKKGKIEILTKLQVDFIYIIYVQFIQYIHYLIYIICTI